MIAKSALVEEKEQALQELCCALLATVEASSRVMLTFNLPLSALSTLSLPSEVAPTVSSLTKEGWVAVQICIPRSDSGRVMYTLKQGGARAIVMQEVAAYSA